MYLGNFRNVVSYWANPTYSMVAMAKGSVIDGLQLDVSPVVLQQIAHNYPR